MKTQNDQKLNPFTQSYIEAMFWTSQDDEAITEKGFYDLAPETFERIKKDCSKFLSENLELINDNPIQAGHDFWLTRNGHGTGFWDRDNDVYGEGNGDILTEKSKEYGSLDLYLGDDGKLYLN